MLEIFKYVYITDELGKAVETYL